MRCQYFIHVLSLPDQAGRLWGTAVDGAPDAPSQVAALLQRQHIDRCLVIEVAATTDGHVGLRQQEHAAALASVYRGWFVVDTRNRRAQRITAPSDLGPLDSTRVLLPREPDLKSAIDYELATKKHALNMRFGRPSSLPPRPPLVDLLEQRRLGEDLGLVTTLLATEGGLAYFRTGASRATLVTWTEEPADVWLARWQAAAAHPDDVSIVDDLPVD